MYRWANGRDGAVTGVAAALLIRALLAPAPAAAGGGAAIRVAVGHPTILSVPGAQAAEANGSPITLRAERISPTALRVSAQRPGSGVLRVRTAAGWEEFRVHAYAPSPAPAADGGSLAHLARWARTAWQRLSGMVPRGHGKTAVAHAPAQVRGVPAPAAPLAGRTAPAGFQVGSPFGSRPPTRAPLRLAAAPQRLSLPRGGATPSRTPFVDAGVPLGRAAPRLALDRNVPQDAPKRPAARTLELAALERSFAQTRPMERGIVNFAGGESRTVPVLIGARPVLAAVQTIQGLPAAQEETDQPRRIPLLEGTSRILPARGLRRVQIDDPTGAIAEVQPLSDTEVLVLGRGPGTTTLRIWDDRGRSEYQVVVEAGPARRQQSIQEAIGIATVKVRVVDNTAILEGDVADVEQVARAQRIAEAFIPRVLNLLRVPAAPAPAPAGPTLAEQIQAVLPPGEMKAEAVPGQPSMVIVRGRVPRVEDIRALDEILRKVAEPLKGTVVNLAQLAEPRQVRLQARMLNVDESAVRDVGIQWSEQVDFTQVLRVDAGSTQAVGSNEFRFTTPIQAKINALIQDTRTEVLASPSIMVNSGGTGNIQVGGLVPIPTVVTGFASAGGGGAAAGGTTGTGGTGVGTVGQTVTYRPFGVLLSVEPVVEQGDNITLRLLIEVSAIDRSNATSIFGSVVPGFTTKRALQEVRLKAGDTLVIGGLISRDEVKIASKFPLLGDIPVLGAFFRSVRKEKVARELVLFLTPELLPGPPPPLGLQQQPLLRPAPIDVFGMGLGATGGLPAGGGAGGSTQPGGIPGQ